MTEDVSPMTKMVGFPASYVSFREGIYLWWVFFLACYTHSEKKGVFSFGRGYVVKCDLGYQLCSHRSENAWNFCWLGQICWMWAAPATRRVSCWLCLDLGGQENWASSIYLAFSFFMGPMKEQWNFFSIMLQVTYNIYPRNLTWITG